MAISKYFIKKGSDTAKDLYATYRLYKLESKGLWDLPTRKEAYAESHKDELTAFNKAYRTLKKHGGDLNVDLKALQKEYDGLRTTHADLKEQLAAVNEELKPMKDIRYWVSKVLSPEQTGEKQPEPKHSLKERLQYEQEQKKQKQVQKAPKQKKQDMEL